MAAVLALVLVPVLRAQETKVDVTSLIETYYQGRHDEAVARAAAIADLGPLRLRFVQDVPKWIQADPASAERRRAAASAFLVELAGARLESDWGRLSDLIEFTCAQVLRGGGPPTEFERAWHKATHALAGRARARLWLLGESPRLAHQEPVPTRAPPPNPRLPRVDVTGVQEQVRVQQAAAARQQSLARYPMHLMHALERFPEDPHFQLSRIVAWTWGRDSEPIRNVGERVRVTVDGFERRRSPQLEALTALEPLRAVPEVSGEAWIRSGHVYFTVGSFKAALSAFEAGADRAPEPEMKFIAMLGAGRALEALARPDEAMKQYQRALDLIPGAESATVALASLEFMRDERDAALRILDRAFASAQTTTDPGRMTGYGSYIRWPEVKAAMRKALP